MKKIIIYITLIALLFSITGCGAKQKIEEKITEKIVETAVGGKVDIDGKEVTVKGENGEAVTFGATEWPKSEIAKNLPEFKKGELTNVISAENNVMITADKVEEQDFTNYYKDIVKNFTKDSYLLMSSEAVTYTGKDDKGIIVSVSYNLKDKSININGSQGEVNKDDSSTPTEASLSDTDISFLTNIKFGDIHWATPEFANKLPEFNKGKIESISASKGYFIIIINDVEKDDYQKYYENVKGSFTVDSFEFNNAESASYYGGNDSGLNITLSYTYNDKIFSISATQN